MGTTVVTRQELLKLLAGNGKRLVIMSGAEGSGKTTLSKALKANHQFKRLSMDSLARKQLIPDIIMLENKYFKKLRKHLFFGYSVVDDNLNLTEDSRRRVHKVATRLSFFGPEVVYVHMDVSLEQCLAWNALRPDATGKVELEINWRKYQRNLPKPSEGRVVRVCPLADGRYEFTD